MIRAARAENPKTRTRDLAQSLGITEAQLVAAHLGRGVTALTLPLETLMPRLEGLGPVMGLTRNESCVIEKDGVYGNYTHGGHAAMFVNAAIDMRLFPSHWVHGYAVETQTDRGPQRSLQVFDAAGDAVHKVFLRAGSDLKAWEALVHDFTRDDTSETLTLSPRRPAEGAKDNPEKLDILRKEWARMTDTHQFLRLVAKLKMNRLGAYRIAGAPFVRPLTPGAVDLALESVQEAGINIMVFVGNAGCIEIHSGPIGTLKPMGPWQNVLDPDFNLHLRRDHIAEVWAVEKPTQRGPALSLEAFDAEGRLILQIFGVGKEGRDHRPAWEAIVKTLTQRPATEAAE